MASLLGFEHYPESYTFHSHSWNCALSIIHQTPSLHCLYCSASFTRHQVLWLLGHHANTMDLQAVLGCLDTMPTLWTYRPSLVWIHHAISLWTYRLTRLDTSCHLTVDLQAHCLLGHNRDSLVAWIPPILYLLGHHRDSLVAWDTMPTLWTYRPLRHQVFDYSPWLRTDF